MDKRLSEIFNFFRPEKLKKDRRIIVFSVCLLIATTLWFLNALSKNYTTTLSYPVKYVNPPKNQFLTNTPPSKLELKVDAYGFTLLRHKLAFSFSPILLDMSYIKENIAPNSNIRYVRTEDLKKQISDQVSKEITITDISPKIITFIFDSLKTKMIEVRPDINVDLEPQFYITDSLLVNPKKIKISGPATILDTLHFLKTEHKEFSDVNSTLEKIIKVRHPNHTSLMTREVKVLIPVEKFTEKKLKIPVEVRPVEYKEQIKLFPSEVTITFMVSLSEYEKVTPEDFKACVYYVPEKRKMETLNITMESQPPGIKMLRIMPDAVEFLIEEN
jgi:YbbR domain-containing protein